MPGTEQDPGCGRTHRLLLPTFPLAGGIAAITEGQRAEARRLRFQSLIHGGMTWSLVLTPACHAKDLFMIFAPDLVHINGFTSGHARSKHDGDIKFLKEQIERCAPQSWQLACSVLARCMERHLVVILGVTRRGSNVLMFPSALCLTGTTISFSVSNQTASHSMRTKIGMHEAIGRICECVISTLFRKGGPRPLHGPIARIARRRLAARPSPAQVARSRPFG